MYCSNGHRLARLPANQAEESTIATGTVKFFSTYRGYGFIQPSDSSPDIFVHISVVQRAGRSHLVGGQKVSFDVVIKAGKSAAGNLKVNLPICCGSVRFSAEFGTLVVIHDPELRDVPGVTVAAKQHASAGGTFVPILMDSWCLEFGQSFESSVVFHQL